MDDDASNAESTCLTLFFLQRRDDTADALKTRLEQYWSKTTPILDHYAPNGIVKKVNADQSIAEVWSEVKVNLESGR